MSSKIPPLLSPPGLSHDTVGLTSLCWAPSWALPMRSLTSCPATHLTQGSGKAGPHLPRLVWHPWCLAPSRPSKHACRVGESVCSCGN